MIELKEKSDLTPEKISLAFFGAGVGIKERVSAKYALLNLVGRNKAIAITTAAFNIANNLPEVISGGGAECVHRPFRKYLERHPELLPGGNRVS
ncbi:MAG: hypothetical protein ACPG05_00690 [Bdellovibrionales bacterium]